VTELSIYGRVGDAFALACAIAVLFALVAESRRRD